MFLTIVNKKIFFQKILALWLAVLLTVNPLAAKIAFAEGEETPTPTPTPETQATPTTAPEPTSSPATESPTPTAIPTEQVTPSPTSEPTSTVSSEGEITPTPTPQTTITTGDASAVSETQTTANTNETPVPGELSAPTGNCTPPEGQTSCPGDLEVKTDNTATISGEVNSASTTGDNQITGSGGDAAITSGDATASGSLTSEVNTNLVTLEPSTAPTSDVGLNVGGPPSEESTLTPPPASQTLTVENNNEGKVSNEANVSASTGGNIASENLGDAQIETGDALAWVNIFNLLNTNIFGSNFEILVLDLVSEENKDIDLNELWKKIQEQIEGNSLSLAGEQNLSHLLISILNQNQGDLENKVQVTAITGGNQADGNNNATIETGQAISLANVANLVNTNILGSKFFFGIINIFAPNSGNLILPRPERFLSQAFLAGAEDQMVIFANQNWAEMANNVFANADSGANQANNNEGGSVETGDAQAVTNAVSIANTNLWRNKWFYLIINNLGGWQGKIFSWQGSSSVDSPAIGGQTFQVGAPEESSGEGSFVTFYDPLLPETDISFENQNEARIRNEIITLALTGQNQANGNRGYARINTGRARSAINLFNLANLNIFGSRWFFGLINVLGNWTGNAIFAYPDVIVGLHNGIERVKVGEKVDFTVEYQNQGYDEANDVKLKIDLPAGISYSGDSSGLPLEANGQTCAWTLGKLEAKKGGRFTLTISVNADFKFEESLSFWSKIIPQVYAAENSKEKTITLIASIGTGDPESDLSNNFSSASTTVYLPNKNSQETSGGLDHRQPKLEITAWNNVNQFVYPGDTVTFEITVKNNSDVPSYDTYLTQGLFNGVPGDFGVTNIKVGTVEPGKKAKIGFGMQLTDDGLLPSGSYYTLAQAFGYAPDGNEVSSNEARTDFAIRWSEVLAFDALAAEEKVLGEEHECPVPQEKILPYILLFFLSSLWLIDKGRRFSQRELV